MKIDQNFQATNLAQKHQIASPKFDRVYLSILGGNDRVNFDQIKTNSMIKL